MKINKFLHQLLQFEQDGKCAISAPSNWNDRPLLEITTEIADTVDKLAHDLLNDNETARWHFFIGSPGNGKSAAVGRLYRTLQSNNVTFKTRDKTTYTPDTKELPYVLDAYSQGKNYAFAYIAQDASVVADPYANEINPATDMLNLIDSAWAKKKSLVICANRGIIEEAVRIGGELMEIRQQSWFKNIFQKLAKADYKSEETHIQLNFDSNKKDRDEYTSLIFSTSILDFQSIVLNRPNGDNYFDQLITQAVQNNEWNGCETCQYNHLCPFQQNRAFLLERSNRQSFIKIIKRAEVYSGQVIVFREALALLALILAGSTDDLLKENVKTPCEWVKRKVENNEPFDLLGRRIYITLFSSFSPYGFEYSSPDNSALNITKEQKRALSKDSKNTISKFTFHRLLETFHNSWLSLNLGLNRLIGERGVLQALHPIQGIPLNNFENEIQSKWAIQLETLANALLHPLITEIEKAVFQKLNQLEEAILQSNEDIPRKLSWLSRWTTSITYNIGVLDTCYCNFDKDLDQLIEAFENPENEKSNKITRLFKESVKNIFNDENNKLVFITKNMAIKNFNVEAIRIAIPKFENKTYGLEMRFGNSPSTPVIINAQTYCWLISKLNSHLSSSTFPNEYLETLKVSQLKAVKDLHYNKMDDVEIIIKSSSNLEHTVKREEGIILKLD